MNEYLIPPTIKISLEKRYNNELKNIGYYVFKGRKFILALNNNGFIVFDEYGCRCNLSNQELGLNSYPCVLVYNNIRYYIVPSANVQLDSPSVFIFNQDRSYIAQSLYGCKKIHNYQDDYIIVFDKPYKERLINNELIVDQNKLLNLYDKFCYNIQDEYELAYPIISIKNKVTVEYKYWKYINGSMLFINKLKIHIILNNKFCPLSYNTYIWSHNDHNLSLIEIDNTQKKLLRIKLLSPKVNDFLCFESKFLNINKSYNYYLSDKVIVFHRGHDGILVIDRYGNELWNSNSNSPYQISDLRGNLIYCISDYRYLYIYDLRGNKISEANIIRMANGNIKTKNGNELVVSSLNNRKGVVDIYRKIEMAPCIYDNITIVNFEDLPITQQSDRNSESYIGSFHSEKNEYYLAYLKNDLFKSCILFSKERCLISPGQFDEIIPILYIDSMCLPKYRRNEYGIDVYSPICGKKEVYSGWFLLKRESKFYLRFSNSTFEISSLKDLAHPEKCSFYIIVRTSNGIGLLSPLGWIFEPIHESIARFSTDKSDSAYGSASLYGQWHVFLVDNDIYRVRINHGISSYINDVEIIFNSEGKYKFMNWNNTSYGIDFYFIGLDKNSGVKINIYGGSENNRVEWSNNRIEWDSNYNSDEESTIFYYDSGIVYEIENDLVKVKKNNVVI